MMRGTFANVRLRNKLTPEREGAYTRHLPDGEEMFIFDASEKYRREGTPLLILAGKEYGSGSSRDWAAKGPRLLGVRAVLAESFERIHRSNLVGMGILPLQFLDDENAATCGLNGEELYDIVGLTDVLDHFAPGKTVKVRASTLRRKCSTTSTAASCSTFCASCCRAETGAAGFVSGHGFSRADRTL
jgi:aconitate hydratase